ncbi:putative bifunctional phosphopantothenoylcysteine decarboxylase/phosphopantothenate synthase [Magnetofaba australis IT-1]|uniref:Coenzyme A biosynthesis bifunctional protein CoaBC n=1 Tax=Magnetofaba australis IT-1 TaxID=1434232 RepID=A0A1Y2K7U1_9PROT|nr:putative bifunctional phosphopantothenoylcysteine decarboxylase/phosphopantothenate synthase [Magnetofaba australis IT-1]
MATHSALEFVTPLTLGALAEAPVHTELMSLTQEREMGHIRLAREADLVVVAPITAHTLARLANGLADDLLTAMLLARRGPTLLAPAMNAGMWENPATQRNVAQVVADGYLLAGPTSGALACGESGVGRMAEPLDILEAARRALSDKPLAGRRILITAGPTREAVDPVRYVSNHSSGRMGFAIAQAALRLGAEAELVHGPVSLPPVLGAQMTAVTCAEKMQAACLALWPRCDAAVMTAAVADFRPESAPTSKIKKQPGQERMTLELTRNPDILAAVCAARRPGQVVMGFAAETDDLLANAQAKLARKGCDLLAANDVSDTRIGFGSERNRITLLAPGAEPQAWPEMDKETLAEKLLLALAQRWDAA